MRDIAGYWEDCGCNGESIGGISRFPHFALGSARVIYVFVGRLSLPRAIGSDRLSQAQSGLLAQASLQHQQSLEVLAALDEYYLIPDEEEFRELAGAGVDLATLAPRIRESLDLGWCNISRDSVNGATVGLRAPDGAREVQLPPADQQSRKILVLAHWIGSAGALRDATLDLGLGISLSGILDRDSSHSEAFDRVAIALAIRDSGIITYWRPWVTGRVPVDERMHGRVVRARLRALHSASGDTTNDGRPRHSQLVDECGSCHLASISKWKTSRHFDAYASLVAAKSAQDARCLPCHTTTVPGDMTRQVHKDVLFHVTCYSCHTDNHTSPREVCVECHTDLTDSKGSYKKAIATICDGKRDNLRPTDPHSDCGRSGHGD